MSTESRKESKLLVNIRRQKTIIGANVFAMILISIVIFVFVSYINDRHYYRFDFTASGKYTLSSKTKNILENLDQPVFITTLLVHNPDYRFYGQILDILEEYKYKSNKIKVNHINPLTERTKITELSEKLKMDLEQLKLNSIIFACGDKNKHVQQSEVIEREFPFKFKGEDIFTSAILNVTQEKQTTIYYTKGHGERDLKDFERAGLGDLANAIKRANYNIIPLDLLKKKSVPENCDILFIAGPIKSFLTEETNYIRNYLGTSAKLVDEKGELKEGKLLVMLEPAFGTNKPSGLKPLLGEYGILVRDDAVVYNKINMPLFGMQTVAEVYVDEEKYQDHEITNDIKGLMTLFFGSCVVNVAPLNDTMAFSAKAIAQAPDNSWGETEMGIQKKPNYDKDIDISSPISLAVASELREPEENPTSPPHATKAFKGIGKKGSRIVVFGDVDFAANAFSDKPGNQDFILNAVSWLARKEKELGISPKAPDIRRTIIKPAQLTVVFWLSIVGLPFIGLLVGSIVWWKRRR
ncbi:MAG: GldG family protein [Candidatus Scalinduaceae bacterium]